MLVEGASDQAAVLTLADRLGRDLSGEGVLVAATGGATNIGATSSSWGRTGSGSGSPGCTTPPRSGSSAAAAAGRARLPRHPRRARRLGFFACVDDLEDELIRALGVAGVLAVVEDHGDLPAYRILQRQPAHRDSTDELRLRRFLGTTSGRKREYAGLLAAALDLRALPDRSSSCSRSL